MLSVKNSLGGDASTINVHKVGHTFNEIPNNFNGFQLKELHGKSVVMNQMNANNAGGSDSKYGVIWVNNLDGSWNANGTATRTVIKTTTTSPINLLNRHKYYFKGCPKGGADNTYQLGLNWGTSQAYDYGSGAIYQASADLNAYLRLRIAENASCSETFYPQIFDLTAMFGSGNEPTLAECQQIFTEDYYPYMANTIRSTESKRVVSNYIGQLLTNNAYDFTTQGVRFLRNTDGSISLTGTHSSTSSTIVGIWGYNYATTELKAQANHKYLLKFVGASTLPSEISIQVVAYDSNATSLATVHTRADEYIYVAPSTASKIAIRFYLDSTSGANVPVSVLIKPNLIDLTAIFGTGNEPTLEKCRNIFTKDYYPFEGDNELSAMSTNVGILRSAGDVSDYIDYDNMCIVRRVGVVDLGSINWSYVGSGSVHAPYLRATFTDVKYKGYAYSVKANILTGTYITAMRSEIYFGDKTMCMDGDSTRYTEIQIKDSAYTDATAFKTAMSGVMLQYELLNPWIEPIESLDDFIEVEPNGTITFESDFDAEGLNIPIEYKGILYKYAYIKERLNAPKLDGIAYSELQKNKVAYLMGTISESNDNSGFTTVKEWTDGPGSSETTIRITSYAISDNRVVMVGNRFIWVYDIAGKFVSNPLTFNGGVNVTPHIFRISDSKFCVLYHYGRYLASDVMTLSADGKTLTATRSTMHDSYDYNGPSQNSNRIYTVGGNKYFGMVALSTRFNLYSYDYIVENEGDISQMSVTDNSFAINKATSQQSYMESRPIDGTDKFIYCNTPSYSNNNITLTIDLCRIVKNSSNVTILSSLTTSFAYAISSAPSFYNIYCSDINDEGMFWVSFGVDAGYSNGTSFYALCKIDDTYSRMEVIKTYSLMDIRKGTTTYPYGGSGSRFAKYLGDNRWMLSINDSMSKGSIIATTALYAIPRYQEIILKDDYSIANIYSSAWDYSSQSTMKYIYDMGRLPNGDTYYVTASNDHVQISISYVQVDCVVVSKKDENLHYNAESYYRAGHSNYDNVFESATVVLSTEDAVKDDMLKAYKIF